MNDLISRQAAIDAFNLQADDDGWWCGTAEDMEKLLKGLPSAEPNATGIINRQVAIDRINEQRKHLQPDVYPQDKIGDAAYRICSELIERLPSAQPEKCENCGNFDKARLLIPQPERKGKWKGYNADDPNWLRTDGSPVFLICSECGQVVLNNISAHWNYCSNCGAKMEVEG